MYIAAPAVRVFAIVGIKHYEDKDAQKYKGRVVVSGDKVKTATGQWAVFQEIGTVPSTMAARLRALSGSPGDQRLSLSLSLYIYIYIYIYIERYIHLFIYSSIYLRPAAAAGPLAAARRAFAQLFMWHTYRHL